METYSGAGHSGTNCLFVCQRGGCKSFAVYKLIARRVLADVAKEPHFVARVSAATANLFRQL
jgi:hypothetical protein